MQTTPESVASPPLLQRQTLAQSAIDRLREGIISGVYAEGMPMTEPALAATLGISRAPVREALQWLERQGLIESDNRGRSRVCVLKPQDFEDIYTLRLALEPTAAGHAVRRLMAADIDLLEANIERTQAAQELADVSRLDVEFHSLVLEASGRPRLITVWQSFRHLLELWLQSMHRKHEMMKGPVQEETVNAHRSLLSVLKSGDSKAARLAVQQHIENWYDLMPPMEGSA